MRHLSLALFSLTLSHSFENVKAAFPNVDYDRMGSVGFAGAFSGFGFFDNTSSFTLEPTSTTLFSRNSVGALQQIASTNPGGRINAGCVIEDTLYFGGNFSTVGNQSLANLGLYSVSKNQVYKFDGETPNGEVHAIFCDRNRSQLWLGGEFTRPTTAVAILNLKTNAWESTPTSEFLSRDAVVRSISQNQTGNGLLFGGSFFTSSQNGSINITSTNNPNVPYSSGASPYSSSLVPVPLQNAQIDASPSSTDAQFSDFSKVLCPSGSDGPGNTWFAADGGVTAVINIRTFMSLNLAGLRLGNTFQPNHGTTAFSVVSIPDNTPLTLKYLDPATGLNKTCGQPCPLSTNSSILYQDFIFDRPTDVTGLQIQLSSFVGQSAGLHLLQLLSSGAFASAIGNQNGLSCYAPNPSNITLTGSWSEKSANTNIPGTVQTTLISNVDVGTTSANGPSITWRPYVSATGQYEVNLLIPGCTTFQDCDLRTSVKVVLFPGEGLDPIVKTISQSNRDDVVTNIYTGPIVPTSSQFETTVTLTLADQPEGQGQNGRYEIVADRVQLSLLSANTSAGSQSSGGMTGSQPGAAGFGIFELDLDGPLKNFTSTNISTTSSNSIARALSSALGGTQGATSTRDIVYSVVQHQSGTTYIAGQFSLTAGPAAGASNIVAYQNGALVSLSQGGLNNAIYTLAIDGDLLYVGGIFTNSAANSSSDLQHVAAYDIARNQWQPLKSGVNGPVDSIVPSGQHVNIAGNFTALNPINGVRLTASGLASWSQQTLAWTTSPASVSGSFNLVIPSDSQSLPLFLSGQVRSYQTYGGNGIFSVKNGNTKPQIEALNVSLGAPAPNTNQLSTRELRERSYHLGRFNKHKDSFNPIISRQMVSTPLPPYASRAAPTVFTGAFWTNTSSSDQVTIIGGNFSFTVQDQAHSSVAFYSPSTSTLSSLAGPSISGTVYTLHVVDNLLFIGGAFEISERATTQFAIYDLSTGSWQSSVNIFEPMNGVSIVRSITSSQSIPNKVIIAGSFAGNGSANCQSICAWDYNVHQWFSLGQGIQGEVTSIAYGGNNGETLVAAGSLVVQGNSANVAVFSTANTSWTGLGTAQDYPGPVTAVEVNNGNTSSIFAAGRSTDGTNSYLKTWNGRQWTDLGLTGTSDISQLRMVPLQDTHQANGVIEKDRMLLMSGSLNTPSFGSATAALFDGVSLTPYLMGETSSGTPGFISEMFHSLATFSFTQRSFLATGIVILISIAIAAGVVFLLALIGILVTLFSRREDPLARYDDSDDGDDDSTKDRPSSLLEHINAATRTTILGAGAYGLADEKYDGHSKPDQDPFAREAIPVADIQDEKPPAPVLVDREKEESRTARVRYSFDGAEDGELVLIAGTEVEVLDDKDSAWWYARDQHGKEGVVPAAYLY